MAFRAFDILLFGVFAIGSIPARSQDIREPQKVILDTDFSTFNDDGQVLILAAQEHKAGRIQLMGVTLVAGNSWIEEQRVQGLKAIERVGLDKEVPVYSGAEGPLLHSLASFEQEKALLGVGDGYYGAWSKARPKSDADVASPLDGRAERTQIQKEHAADFIIATVRANPRQVTILAIGPVTNVALAIRKAPDIVPLIGRIIYMGGAFDVPGNTMPAAEFNVWFDPEAARIVYREPIAQVFIPLDVTNSARYPLDFEERIAKSNPVLARIYTPPIETPDRPPRTYTAFWDQLAMAYLVDPSMATDVQERWVDVETTFGINYGRTISYKHEFPQANFLQKAQIVMKFDLKKFEEYFVETMRKPLPVK